MFCPYGGICSLIGPTSIFVDSSCDDPLVIIWAFFVQLVALILCFILLLFSFELRLPIIGNWPCMFYFCCLPFRAKVTFLLYFCSNLPLNSSDYFISCFSLFILCVWDQWWSPLGFQHPEPLLQKVSLAFLLVVVCSSIPMQPTLLPAAFRPSIRCKLSPNSWPDILQTEEIKELIASSIIRLFLVFFKKQKKNDISLFLTKFTITNTSPSDLAVQGR